MRLDEIENNWDGYKLVTSNESKLEEFKRYGLNLTIEKGRDLPEVQGTDIEVITYKALDAGPKRIVEDTSLNIDGADIGVNIRWMVDQISKFVGSKAEWVVLLGVNTGDEIRIYKGSINGEIVHPTHENAFGFDGVFKVSREDKTLAELEDEGKKDDYSARKEAIKNLLNDNPLTVKDISTIEEWKGEYQH